MPLQVGIPVLVSAYTNAIAKQLAQGPTSGDNERIETFHVNVIYKFWGAMEAGLEYMYGQKESFGDSEGEMNVVNFRLRYYF